MIPSVKKAEQELLKELYKNDGVDKHNKTMEMVKVAAQEILVSCGNVNVITSSPLIVACRYASAMIDAQMKNVLSKEEYEDFKEITEDIEKKSDKYLKAVAFKTDGKLGAGEIDE